MRHFSPRAASMLTDVVIPVPLENSFRPVRTRTIRVPVPFRYRTTRKRSMPLAVGPSRATPSKMMFARARCWAAVIGMQEAAAAVAIDRPTTATARKSIGRLSIRTEYAAAGRKRHTHLGDIAAERHEGAGDACCPGIENEQKELAAGATSVSGRSR